jgi:hypothetical protein
VTASLLKYDELPNAEDSALLSILRHKIGRICDDGGRSWKVQRLRDMQKKEKGSKSSEKLTFTVLQTVVAPFSLTDRASVRLEASCMWPMP